MNEECEGQTKRKEDIMKERAEVEEAIKEMGESQD
jgi:hypothetical protein